MFYGRCARGKKFCQSLKMVYNLLYMEVFMENDLDLSSLVGEKELKAYESYLELTSFSNYLTNNNSAYVATIDYSNRDMSYPIDITIKE